jgi:polar amino acid transport system substrate-binding protein
VRRVWIATIAGLALLLAGCALPRDPEGTLERVRGGTLRVGITAAEPWTRVEGRRPAGVEVELVRGFARGLRAEIEWAQGSETELVEALAERELDLLVGGLARDTPWSKEVALTRPYTTARVLVGVPRSEGAPEGLEGLRVAVERGDPVAGLLEDEGAVPVRVDDLARARGPVAAEAWRLRELGLAPTRFELETAEHVIAAPMGENAFLVRLERHLLAREAAVQRLLDREEP